MYIQSNTHKILLSNKFFPINIFSLYLFLCLFNIIYSGKISFIRDDTDPGKVSKIMVELINNNYKGKNGENNIYLKNIGDYSLEMKLLFLNFDPEETNIATYNTGRKFFSYIETYMDTIFSLKLIKNRNATINNGVSIIYNSNINSSNLSFQLKNIFANIYINSIEFEKQRNNTYNYIILTKPKISIDKSRFHFPEKINKFLFENENELELFLYESFDNYLRNITDHYPKANGILLYETIIKYLKSFNSFSISSNPKFSDIKINFKEFKEEKIYVEDNAIIFSNVTIKFDINYGSGYYSKIYEEILPYIKCINENFYFGPTNVTIYDLNLKSILEYNFDLIIKYYIDEYLY